MSRDAAAGQTAKIMSQQVVKGRNSSMSSTFFNGYKLSSWLVILLVSQKEAGQQGVRLFKHIGSSRT